MIRCQFHIQRRIILGNLLRWLPMVLAEPSLPKKIGSYCEVSYSEICFFCFFSVGLNPYCLYHLDGSKALSQQSTPVESNEAASTDSQRYVMGQSSGVRISSEPGFSLIFLQELSFTSDHLSQFFLNHFLFIWLNNYTNL